MHLQTIINGKVVKSSSTDANKPTIVDLHLNKTATIDLEVKNIPSTFWLKKAKKEFRWEITNNSNCVDTDDYTGGVKAELKLSKSNAGSKENPSKITVCADDLEENSTVGNITINCSADSKITNTEWTVKECRSHQLVYLTIDQEGLYDHKVTVKVYNQKDPTTPIHTYPELLLKSGTNSLDLGVSNTTKEPKILYYTITHLNKVIYNGNNTNMLLTVAVIDYLNNDDKEFSNNLTPVTIHSEEYFTQKYEPCKYSKIEAIYNGETKILFDETEQPVKTRSNKVLHKMIVSADNQEEITFKIDPITNECRNSGTDESHSLKTFDVSDLDKYNIEYTQKEGDNTQIKINLAYPYKHIEEDKINYYGFFESYFLDYARTINYHLPVQSCRHRKILELNTYPDVAWAFHFHFGTVESFGKIEYYKETEVDLFRGLKDEIKLFSYLYQFQNANFSLIQQQSPFFKLLLERISFMPLGNNLIRDILIMYLEITADSFAAGFHAYYKDKNGLQIIDYGKEYPLIPKAVIAAATAIWITVDIIILVLTYGGSAAVTGTKVAGTAVKSTSKILSTAKDLKTAYSWAKKPFTYYKAYNNFTKLMNGETQTKNSELGDGFEFKVADVATYTTQQTIANPTTNIPEIILERRFAAAPLFSVGFKNEMSIGEFMLNRSGLGAIFGTSRFVFSLVGSFISTSNDFRKKEIKDPTGLVVKTIDLIEAKLVKDIDEIFKDHGIEGKIVIGFGAHIGAHFTLKVNMTQQVLNLFYKSKGLTGKDIKFENATQAVYGEEAGIVAFAKIKADATSTLGLSKINHYIPKFLNVDVPDVSTDTEIKGLIKGSLHLETIFKMVGGTPMYANNYVFSGMKGFIFIKVKVKFKEKNKDIWETSNKKKKDKYKGYKFTLVEPFGIGSDPLPVDEGLNDEFFK